MTITIAGLIGADVDGLIRASAHWEKLIQEVDALVDDMAAATRELPNVWTGRDAEASEQRAYDLRVEIGEEVPIFNTYAIVLHNFAEDLRNKRKALYELVHEAKGHGITIHLPSGRVTGPSDVRIYEQSGVQYYADSITDLMRLLNAFDRDADSKLCDDQAGRVYHQLDESDLTLSSMELANYPSMSPGEAAEWWHWLNPVQRETYAERYPELVGALQGLPTADRDRANRALLRREYDTLTRSPDGSGDAMSRAQTQSADRVAAIEKLQSKKGYILDYTPGHEAKAKIVDDADSTWDGVYDLNR